MNMFKITKKSFIYIIITLVTLIVGSIGITLAVRAWQQTRNETIQLRETVKLRRIETQQLRLKMKNEAESYRFQLKTQEQELARFRDSLDAIRSMGKIDVKKIRIENRQRRRLFRRNKQ